MIPLTTTLCQDVCQDNRQDTCPDKGQKNESWQTELAQAYRDPIELLSALELTPEQIPGGISTKNPFPLRVPRHYVARMQTGDPNDPLLLQVLSRQLEQADQPGFLLDPVGEGPATASPGLLHKYQGRVLLITTGACPIHCRYCFRRHYPYSESRPDNRDWSNTMDYIAADPSINEVILSGGDPLSLSNERLQAISNELAGIPHIRRLRLHTRMPIVLPERVDTGFKDWLSNLPWQTIVVTHCNHANEIDAQVSGALAELKANGTTLLNQAVLLKGVNDNVAALVNLSEALFKSGTLPYYLHLLDRVAGAAHFEVKEPTALRLINEIQCHLPGFLVPKLVREIAGKPHKIQFFGAD
ncbi:MAG: EF-P beta-lysylation protein EpmB [Proteobacteria bacterium]|nr:EF-P beta-lysylation protein EpmB [Pseudomonadota bacterium]